MMFHGQIRNQRPTKTVVLLSHFALFLIATGAAQLRAATHELEDGVVEKTVAVVVRDHTATIELSLGINPSTMQQQLTKWEANSKDPAAAKMQAEESDPDADVETDSPMEADDLEQIESQFRQYAFEQFSQEIKVSVDGRFMSLTKVSVEPSARHHFAMIAKYSFEIPQQQRVKLVIEDQSLESMNGGSRYALKAMGKSILFKSNVAPIIVRAERNDLAELSKQQLAKVSRIEALVGGTFKVAEKSKSAVKSAGAIKAASGTDSKKNK